MTSTSVVAGVTAATTIVAPEEATGIMVVVTGVVVEVGETLTEKYLAQAPTLLLPFSARSKSLTTALPSKR